MKELRKCLTIVWQPESTMCCNNKQSTQKNFGAKLASPNGRMRTTAARTQWGFAHRITMLCAIGQRGMRRHAIWVRAKQVMVRLWIMLIQWWQHIQWASLWVRNVCQTFAIAGGELNLMHFHTTTYSEISALSFLGYCRAEVGLAMRETNSTSEPFRDWNCSCRLGLLSSVKGHTRLGVCPLAALHGDGGGAA